MAAMSSDAVLDLDRTATARGGRDASHYGAIFAVHTTLANPVVIVLLVLVVAGGLLLRRRRGS